MRKPFAVISALFLTFFIVVNNYGASNKSPWSGITNSNNKKYLFVLISSGSLENYAERIRKSWEPLKLSSQELKDYEANLIRNINEEKQIRSLYSSSGLYLKENPKNPQWTISLNDTEKWLPVMDNIFVADDGAYVVGYNPHVAEIENGIPNKEEIGVFIYSPNFGLRSYKVSELTKQNDLFAKSLEGYFWANKEIILDNEHKTFILTKGNNDKLEFSISNGEILRNSSEEKHSTCFGFILLFVLTVWLLQVSR